MPNKDDIKKKLSADAKNLKKSFNKKDTNHLGLVFALVVVFFAILVPIVITDNEVKEAQKAAAEAQRIAFEEARQAAIEAEKEAEEKRQAELNAALRAEQAEFEAQQAAEAAAEKARQEREDLVNSINDKVQESLKDSVRDSLTATVADTVVPSMQDLIEVQTDTDLNMQTSVQDLLLQNQEEKATGYQDYVARLLSSYSAMQAEEFLNQDRRSDELSSAVQFVIDKADQEMLQYEADKLEAELKAMKAAEEAEAARIKAEQEAEAARIQAEAARIKAEKEAEAARIKAEEEAEAARIKAEEDKYNSHYGRRNRLELIGSLNSINLQYIHKFGDHFGLGVKTGYIFDTDKDLLAQASFDWIIVDDYKVNVALDASLGIAYSFGKSKVVPAGELAGILRYTIQDGFELAFRPSVLFETDFKDLFQVKPFALSIGASFTF